MSDKKLHPSVERFKDFVDRHPRVKEQIRNNHKLIQGYYEKWIILGEKDPFWETLPKVQKDEHKKDWFKQLSSMVEELDWEKVSKQIDELNGAIGQFQQLLSDVRRDASKQRKELEYPYY